MKKIQLFTMMLAVLLNIAFALEWSIAIKIIVVVAAVVDIGAIAYKSINR